MDEDAPRPTLCPGHSRPVQQLCYVVAEDVSYPLLLSSCLDGKALIRNANSGDWIGSLLGHKGSIKCVRASRDCQYFGTASTDFTARIWDGRNGEVVKELVHPHMVLTCDFSADHFITGSKKKEIRVYDLEDLDADPVILPSENGAVDFVTATQSSYIFTSSTSEPEIHVWDLRTNEQVRTLEIPNEQPLSSMEYSSDLQCIVCTAGSDILSISVDDLSMKITTVEVEGNKLELSCCSYSPDGDLVCLSGKPKAEHIHVLSASDFSLINVLKGHHGPVHSLAWHPDGSSFASGSEDGTVRIWPLELATQKKTKV
jgi:serine-threonine kinase receptor-associated protein